MFEKYITNILEFLSSRGWQLIEENETYLKYLPPPIFEFEEGYNLSIPKSINSIDISEYLKNITRIISELYDYNYEDLKTLFFDDNTILSLKFEDSDMEQGKILLPKFEKIIEKLRKILLDTASFVVLKRPFLEYTPKESERYIQECKFLQTEKGSFIAKIELPQNTVLRDFDLAPELEVTSKQVNNKLLDVLKFVTEDVLTRETFDDKYLTTNVEKINYQLLKEIQDFYLNSDIENLSYNFLNNRFQETFAVINFDTAKKNNLNNFINAVKNKLFNEFDIDVKAVIFELKSKDPDRNHNLIKVYAIVKHVTSIISINLDNENYKLAVDAHKTKKYVRIVGKVREEMTQYKIIELYDFSIREQITN